MKQCVLIFIPMFQLIPVFLILAFIFVYCSVGPIWVLNANIEIISQTQIQIVTKY